MSVTHCFSRLVSLGSLALVVCLAAGCSSGPKQRDMMSEALSAGEQPVAMRGTATFLEGKLAAVATVSRGFGRGGRGGPRDGRGTGPGGRSRNDDRDVFSDTYSTGFGDSEAEQEEAMKDYIRMVMAQRAAGSPMPPVTLRVTFENHSAEPMNIEVTEVNSELGNFAVRPPRLTIEPGKSGTLEPMISQLGVTSDEIPLKVEVRQGGRKESKIIPVKNLILPTVKKTG